MWQMWPNYDFSSSYREWSRRATKSANISTASMIEPSIFIRQKAVTKQFTDSYLSLLNNRCNEKLVTVLSLLFTVVKMINFLAIEGIPLFLIKFIYDSGYGFFVSIYLCIFYFALNLPLLIASIYTDIE